MENKKISIIGAGNIGGSLIAGLLAAHHSVPENVLVSDINQKHLEKFREKYGIKITTNNAETVQNADILLLAVKPQIIKTVLDGIKQLLNPETLIVSVVAGITTRHINTWIGQDNPVVRAMPNIAARVREAATAICRGQYANDEHTRLATKIFESVGIVQEVNEKQMDAITGLSGSGPAYIYMIIEALTDGGVKMGLHREVAIAMAIQTLLGSAKLVKETGEHPAVLRDQVTTPGGTTIAAIHDLESHGLRSMLISAVITATERSKELGELVQD
ncbi:pyrroline-5-carboxylate reductase [bacterium]|nr:pyrroline-5-carboxylate reductase [bacterium]